MDANFEVSRIKIFLFDNCCLAGVIHTLLEFDVNKDKTIVAFQEKSLTHKYLC
jgi:hypothetical protein